MHQTAIDFDAPLIASDLPRLGEQLEAVRKLMENGEWWRIAELQAALTKQGVKACTQSVSARIRDLRKSRFGGHTVERKRVSSSPTVFAYRMSK